jgi:hypothetical protein
MLVHLDPARVNVSSARAVIEHVRGRLIATTVKTFVLDHFRAVPDPLPPEVTEYLSQLPVPLEHPTNGMRLRLHCDALVWHNARVSGIVEAINVGVPDAVAVPVYADGQIWIYLFSQRMNRRTDALKDPSSEPWPCVADVFCAARGPVAGRDTGDATPPGRVPASTGCCAPRRCRRRPWRSSWCGPRHASPSIPSVPPGRTTSPPCPE